MRDTGLEISGLFKRFGSLDVLRGVDLVSAPGEVTALLGRNGSGKSTLLNCVAGRLAPDAGAIRLHGRMLPPEAAWQRARRGVASTFQDVARPISLSVAELLKLAGPEKVDASPATPGLRAIHNAIAPFADQTWSSLSFGQRKLAGLAIAACRRPRLVLLDEPAAGLDSGAVGILEGVLKSLAGSGVAILMCDHNRLFLERTAGKVAVLSHGKIVAEGKPDAVLASPATLEALI